MTCRIYGEKQEIYVTFRLKNTTKRTVCRGAIPLLVPLRSYV